MNEDDSNIWRIPRIGGLYTMKLSGTRLWRVNYRGHLSKNEDLISKTYSLNCKWCGIVIEDLDMLCPELRDVHNKRDYCFPLADRHFILLDIKELQVGDQGTANYHFLDPDGDVVRSWFRPTEGSFWRVFSEAIK